MRRFLLIASVLMLFVSGWGHVLAAALCPHVKAEHSCCPAQKQEAARHDHGLSASHEAMPMDGMEGMDMQTPATPVAETPTVGGDANSLGQPVEDCVHCMGHSQLPTPPVAVGTADQSSRSAELAAPPATSLVTPPIPALTALVTSRPHGPPGASAPRHVLINIFRI
jgi:hypothetical protein